MCRQPRSGTGTVAGGCTLVGKYGEIESGRKSARPELLRAIAHSKRAKATLVIAKLDRLSRNVAFTPHSPDEMGEKTS